MSKLLKVREVITLKEWIKGSGWCYSQVYSDQVIDISENDLKEIDWDWYEIDSNNPPTVDDDTEITVDLYAVDANIYEDKPLASHSIWASELYKERSTLDDIRKDKLKELDTDGDGINDYDEMYYYNTNPYLSDTDGDGIPDGKEVALGMNPLERNQKTNDKDQQTGGIAEKIDIAKQKAAEQGHTISHNEKVNQKDFER